MKTTIFIIILYIILLKSEAQNESKNWVLPNGNILNFKDSIKLSQVKKLSFLTNANATISDSNGNLLFYTDGTSIITKEHEIMKNGSKLWGHTSVVIVPYPKKENLFYVFTVSIIDSLQSVFKRFDTTEFTKVNSKEIQNEYLRFNEFSQINAKLCYHLVDMNKNKGKGEVISKNNILYQGKQGILADLAVIKHHNQKDFWLVSHTFPKNIFKTYLINENGLDGTPIISEVGKMIFKEAYSNNNLEYHSLKGSPDGKKIVLTNSAANNFQLFYFDNQKGNVLESNVYVVFSPKILIFLMTPEFSNNSKKLYVNIVNHQLKNTGKYKIVSTLYQYDLTSQNNEHILESKKYKYYDKGIYFGGDMQLASDGKIYIRKSGFTIEMNPKKCESYLSCIENPNENMENIIISENKIRFSNYQYPELPNITHLLPPFYDSIKIGESFQRQILFDTQKAEIKMWHTPILQDIILFLNQNKNTKITIIGHTDNEGNKENNKKLSFQRAKSVADYIISQKIDKNRIKIEGLGDTKPIVENNSEENKTKNRRVEFLIE